VAVVETWKQLVGIIVTQSFDAGIITIGIETIFAPTMDVARTGILIRSVAKLGSQFGGISTGKKLNGSTTLPIATTKWCLLIR
jgi:hypothetical protein